jgi:hypothetical protein
VTPSNIRKAPRHLSAAAITCSQEQTLLYKLKMHNVSSRNDYS